MNQLDATITIYWSPRSAQHVSGNLLPIFGSVRLRLTAYAIVARGIYVLGKKDVAWYPSYRTRSATLPLSEPLPTTTTRHYTICCENLSLTLLKMGKRLPGICWADLGDQQIVIVATSWFFYITLPTLMMHGQTQIREQNNFHRK